MHFESSKRAEFAQGKLQAYANTYIVNDDTKETITINSDGAVVLHIGENDYTPLYYNLDKTWLTKPADATVTSVVFSAPNWFGAAKQKPVETDRATVEMSWSAAEEQFTVTTAVTCYKPESEEVSRAYSATTAYYLEKYIDEAQKYMTQYVKGTYTLNDGSGWKIRVDNDGNFFVTFGGEEYKVTNPAPVFVFDKDYTDPESSKGEYGNKGRYLSTVTVPVNGWFADEACTQEAIVKLTWNGKVKNPMDDHQFNLNDPIAIYRKNDDGTVECKYLTGTFYSDEDRKLGEEFLKSLDIAGTYQPTEAEGKWWIVIDENGKVTVHATDSQNNEHTISDVAMDLTMDKKKDKLTFGTITAVTDIKVVIPQWRTAQTNDTLANIMQCAETTFTFVRVDNGFDNGSSYFTPSNTYIYADAKTDGTPWEVVSKSSQPNYNKTLITKNYVNDRAYSEANKAAAKEYFAKYAGTYYIDDPDLDYMITVTEEGQIFWGDLTSVTEPLPADVAFDAIHDANGDGKVNPDETTPVPGTISVWLNGYTTGKVSTSSTKDYYTDGTQRADFTWNDTAEENGTPDTAHVFKSSKSAKGYKGGSTSQTSFAVDKSYAPAEKGSGESEGEPFTKDGTYETTDGEYKIVVATDSSGKTTYNFYRPDRRGVPYPLKLVGSGDKAYLRGKIGQMKKADVYIVVTKIPDDGYENFLFTAYEVTYNDLDGKQTTSASAPTVTLPAMTRFTDYGEVTTGEGPFIVAHEGESMADGTRYSRLSLALHNVRDGDTIYLEEDISATCSATSL